MLDNLVTRKTQYEEKYNYYRNIGFDTLAAEFQGIVNLIEEMENYIKEKENGKEV